ncbi:MAG: ExeA family protein [Isosphaerales bacterium]
MEREHGLLGNAIPPPHGDDAQHAASSRGRALERVRAAVENGQAGPVLITGEPGAGKTWHAHRLAALLPDDWRTLFVDLARAMNALDFLRLVGHALGVSVTNRLGAARLLLRAVLQDEATDGRRWLLVVDEAHRGSAAVWDEIQAIVNQLGHPSGFAALLVLGQTELVRALSTRSHSAFASRLSLHVHLMPLDLDEARDLLGYPGRTSASGELAIEELHRDACGNPGKLLRLARSRPGPWQPGSDRDQRRQAHARKRLPATHLIRPEEPLVIEDDEPVSDPATGNERAVKARSDAPPLIPARPPIRDEDGLVEVGWEGDIESELVQAGAVSTVPRSSLADDPSFNEELIEDRYAALQARAEWTRGQGRSAGLDPAAQSDQPGWSPPQTAGPEEATGAEPTVPSDPAASTGPPAAIPPAGIRAESQHEFAPYSHLFTRLRAKG